MEPTEIKSMLEEALPECEISVQGGDGKFHVTAVGAVFEGLNPVKRQQSIYKVLNDQISSGAIHAVTMRLLTQAENETS